MPPSPGMLGSPSLPLSLQWRLGAPWRNAIARRGDPAVTVTSGLTGNVTSVPTTGDYAYSFIVDQTIAGWKIKVVPSAASPHTSGYLVESGGGVLAGVPITGSISWTELHRAGQADVGTKIIKFFARDAAGNWGGGDPPSPAPFPSLLRVTDSILVDENDAPVKLLKGFNIHVAPTIGGEAFSWGAEHFVAIADAGGRICRVVCHWDVFQKTAGPGGIDMTAVASLDSTVAKCEAAGIYVLLELHLNVGRVPAWAQSGSFEFDWFVNNGRDIVQFFANRYGNPTSPQYTKAVISFCPNEPPTTNTEELISGYEVSVPWYRDIAPGWLIWVAPTAYGQGNPYPGNGTKLSQIRYLRLDTNDKGVVCGMRDYFEYDSGTYGPYQPNGAIAPSYQVPGTFTAVFGDNTIPYPGPTAKTKADHQLYMAPWTAWKAEGKGRIAIALEEFGGSLPGNEGNWLLELVSSWRSIWGGPDPVAEIWWNYDVASLTSNIFSPRPGGVWRDVVYGWLSSPEPPIPVSSLAVFGSVSRAQTDDITSHAAIGTSSWTHSPPQDVSHGVVVATLQPLSAADEISGVTYGGQALTRYASYASATARIYFYFLGVGVPDGPQTVAVTSTGTAAKQSHCYLAYSDGRDMIVDSFNGADLGAIANPSLTVPFTGSLASQVSVSAHCYGGVLPPSQTGGAVRRTGVNVGFAHDPGAATGETGYRSGDAEAPNAVFGYSTLASATNLIGAITIKEKPGDVPTAVWANAIPDPSFEASNANGFWTPTGGTLTFPSGVAGADRALACRVTATTATPSFTSPNSIGVDAGWTYTFMLNVLELPAGRTVSLAIDWKDSSFFGGRWGPPVKTTIGTTGQMRLQTVAPDNASYCQLTVQLETGGVIGDVFTVDAALFAQGVYNGAYFDGATAGASWSGPADNSASFKPV